jgi:hypothetical protein
LELDNGDLCQGTVLGLFDYALREGAQRSGTSMLQAQSFHQRQERLIWVFVMARIGQGLRERYQFPKDLPPVLLALIGRLDAREDDYLLRYAPPLDRRSLAENDWLPERFVWQRDTDLFAV